MKVDKSSNRHILPTTIFSEFLTKFFTLKIEAQQNTSQAAFVIRKHNRLAYQLV